MKKSIKNLDAKSIKNTKAIKGGDDGLGKRRDAEEEKTIPSLW
jgi:hypothetical protein